MEDFEDWTLLKQGAEAKLRVGTFLGQKAVLKERFSKTYRHPELDSRLTKDRFKGEVRSLLRCKTLGIRTPTLYYVDVDSSSFVMEPLPGAIFNTGRSSWFVWDRLDRCRYLNSS